MTLMELSGVLQLYINIRWSVKSCVLEKPSKMLHIRVISEKNKRVLYTLDPATKKREVQAEWHFNDTDLSLCRVNQS